MSTHDYGFPVSADTRIDLPGPEDMTVEQRAVHDAVVSGPRGRMIGPLRAVIHSPELADKWQQLGALLRYGTVLPEALKELAIVVCSRYWNSDLEWAVHSRIARTAGISEAVLEQIENARPVEFASQQEHEIYEFSRFLLGNGQVPDDIYSAVRRRWGDRGVVELTGIVGYYSMVAMTVNVHLIPVPEGEVTGIRPLGATLTQLAPGEVRA